MAEFFMFHMVKIPRKIKKSGFPDYILIYILLSKCLQSFTIRLRERDVLTHTMVKKLTFETMHMEQNKNK